MKGALFFVALFTTAAFAEIPAALDAWTKAPMVTANEMTELFVSVPEHCGVYVSSYGISAYQVGVYDENSESFCIMAPQLMALPLIHPLKDHFPELDGGLFSSAGFRLENLGDRQKGMRIPFRAIQPGVYILTAQWFCSPQDTFESAPVKSNPVMLFVTPPPVGQQRPATKPRAVTLDADNLSRAGLQSHFSGKHNQGRAMLLVTPELVVPEKKPEPSGNLPRMLK